MERVANFAGSIKKLEDAITAPQPSHPDFKLVPHSDSAAYAMVAIPDYMAAQTDCSKMTPGKNSVVAVPASAPKNYGKYYATGLQLTKGRGTALRFVDPLGARKRSMEDHRVPCADSIVIGVSITFLHNPASW
jgi:hypothetical protein